MIHEKHETAFEVFLFRGSRFLGSRCFTTETVSIGSSPTADLRLDDPLVEPHHAQLRVWSSGEVELTSAPGRLTINGERAEGGTLSPMDEATVGPFRFKVTPLIPLAPPEADDHAEEAVTVVRRVQFDDLPAAIEEEPTAVERRRPRPSTGPAPAVAAADPEHLDDEDEDEPFVEPFSLLENVVRERFKRPLKEAETHRSLEVIHYQDGEIRDLLRADPGRSIHVGLDNFELLTMEPEAGGARLFFGADFKGTIVRGGRTRSLRSFRKDRFRAERQRHVVRLEVGDYAQVLRGGAGYLVRFVKAPAQPATQRGPRFRPRDLQVFAASAALHLMALALVGFAAPDADLYVPEEEIFRSVHYKAPKLEQPKDEQPIVEQAPVASPTPKAKVRKVKTLRSPLRPGLPKPGKAKTAKQVAKVLGALENLRPASAGPGRADLKALSSNIAAVRVPGSGVGFKVGGTIAKGGSEVRLAGGIGGGGGRDTRTGTQLLSGRGGGTGSIAAIAGTGTRVRRKPVVIKRRPVLEGGDLRHGAIQKVVNQHMAAIQRCYEVQLFRQPSLAGKVVFDWTISPMGSVSSARQYSSSLRSTAVSSCILALIRSWRFPQPVGGAVKVRYPFIFRSRAFN
jgi:FHA domain